MIYLLLRKTKSIVPLRITQVDRDMLYMQERQKIEPNETILKKTYMINDQFITNINLKNFGIHLAYKTCLFIH
jgi:hypothetical protein